MDVPEGLTAAHERRQVPGGDPGWAETWHFDFAAADASLGGFVRVVLLPNQRTCWYWAWVIGDGREPVMVVDHDVPLPPGRSLELRTEGLWADHTVEVPFDHVTLGAEAFALRLDDPDDALAPSPVGDRVPFGLDLEWDTTGIVHPATADPANPSDADNLTGYEIPCGVHGEVLVADARIIIDQATGHRHHTWGVANHWATPWARATGTLTDGTSFQIPFPGAGPHVPTTLDVDGIRRLTVEPLAVAPIRLDVATGGSRAGITHLTRTLCRYTGTGVTGAGWLERNEPS